jgi:predicted DNA-binding protein YlxM (UPF0122 family)
LLLSASEYIFQREVFGLANNVEITILYDFYGDMLTDKQRDFLNFYYNDDLSLSEIAENEGITRQGVRDAIKRAEAQLYEMESKLGFAKRFEEISERMNEIIDCADQINAYNLEHDLSREVNETTVKIKSLALSVIE